MQEGPIQPTTANSLVQGYCDDFVALAAVLAQTLEQASMRNVDLKPSRPSLVRIEQGMRDLADAIRDLLAKPAPAPVPAPAPTTTAAATAKPRAATGPRPQPKPQEAPVRSKAGPRPANGRPAQRTGGLQGTTQSMPLLSVFQFLGRMRKSGTLRVHMPNEELAFVLEQGCIAFATSDKLVAEERLGDLLVEGDVCTRDQLEVMKALAHQDSTELLGQQVIEAGIATHAQVLQALEAQVRSRFQRACKAHEASYEFVEGLKSATDSRFRPQPLAIA